MNPSQPIDVSDAAMVRVHVLFFGVLAQQVGRPHLLLELKTQPATVESAVTRLQEHFPSIAMLRNKLAFAVNLEYVPATCELKDRDELALIPPVSGG